jgi:ABC-type sugar transport system permease subunit
MTLPSLSRLRIQVLAPPLLAAACLTPFLFRIEALEKYAQTRNMAITACVIAVFVAIEMAAVRKWPFLKPYFYLQPTFLLLAVFAYIPPVQAFYRAFFRWKQNGSAEFIGLDHFRYMLYDADLLQAFRNLFILSLFQVTLAVTVPLAVAELVFSIRSRCMRYWYRMLLIIPMVVPTIVIFLLWEFLMDADIGLLNRLLVAFGMQPLAWFKDPYLALYCFIIMGFPWVSGISVLIYLAGLANISPSILESSRLEGASFVQRFLNIDLPLLKGQIMLVVVLAILGTFNGWIAQWVITKGGPGNRTLVPALHMFLQAMRFDYMGYACAIGLVLFFIALGLTYANTRLLRMDDQ